MTQSKRPASPPLSVLVGLALSLSLSCGGPPPEEAPCALLLPGDVVLTEVMVDPAGTDTGREYVELFNATAAEVDLSGVELWVARADGSQEKAHRLAGPLLLPAGGHVALGDVREGTPLPAWLAASYGEDLGGLPNGGGRVGVRCGTRLLDELRWEAPVPTGAALELDGAHVPDSLANDTPAHLCAARTSFATDGLGSPGAPNAPCPHAAADGGVEEGCVDAESGALRPRLTPGPGELVLTEVMANPAAADDAEGEWVEVHAVRTVDLAGLSLATGSSAGARLGGEGCLTVAAGTHALLARSADPARNGGLPAVLATFTASLSNAGGTLSLRAGEVLIDTASFPARPAARAGVASQLPGAPPEAQANDVPEALCDATQALPGGDVGTPGAPNTACAAPEEGATDAGVQGPPEALCVDTTSGQRRPVVAPLPGEVRISELMPNPATAPDTSGEWVELVAARSVDLNGLSLGTSTGAGGALAPGEACVHLARGHYALWARSADAALNGGLPPVAGVLPLALANTGGTLVLRAGETVVDARPFGARPSASEGVALQLPPEALAADGGTDVLCDATAPRGGGERGTPGAPNTPCAPAALPDAGVEGCLEARTGERRALRVPQTGDLVLNEWMANPAGSDAEREYVELYASRRVDLNGVRLRQGSSAAGTTLQAEECLAVEAGSYVLLARRLEASLNGGLPPPRATFGFDLPNCTSDCSPPRALQLWHGDTLLDAVDYVRTVEGVATQVRPERRTPLGNDAPDALCTDGLAPGYGAGGRGTPGAANACP